MVVPKGFGERIKSELRIAATADRAGHRKAGRRHDEGQPRRQAVRRVPGVAIEAVPVAGIFGRAIDTMRLWFN
jgi:hypothetical protein